MDPNGSTNSNKMLFIKHITKTIQRHQLIQAGDSLLIGVSGGADSVALLEALCTFKNEWGLKLTVVHINHGLRKGADADQRFVERLCQKKKVACKSIRIAIPKNPKDSVEQIARKKRFDALIKTARRIKADSIVLGHHQNDLAETVLMRIIRGSGLQGLQAILPKRKIDGMTVIRPLLFVTRDDIETFLAKRKIKYRKDPTNQNERFLRNKIRHTLLNCLATKYNPNIREVLSGLAETSSLDYEFITQKADQAFKTLAVTERRSIILNTAKLKEHHPALQRMIFRKAFASLKGDLRTLTLEHMRAIETMLTDTASAKSQIHLPSGIKIYKKDKNTVFQK